MVQTVGDRRPQPVRFAPLHVVHRGRQVDAEGDVDVALDPFGLFHAEADVHPFQLGVAQQVVGAFDGAVGGVVMAAVQDHAVVVFVHFQHGGGHGHVAAGHMHGHDGALVEQLAQQSTDLPLVAQQVALVTFGEVIGVVVQL